MKAGAMSVLFTGVSSVAKIVPDSELVLNKYLLNALINQLILTEHINILGTVLGMEITTVKKEDPMCLQSLLPWR